MPASTPIRQLTELPPNTARLIVNLGGDIRPYTIDLDDAADEECAAIELLMQPKLTKRLLPALAAESALDLNQVRIFVNDSIQKQVVTFNIADCPDLQEVIARWTDNARKRLQSVLMAAE